MPYEIIIGLALLFAVIDWIAILFTWKRVEFLSKPSVILLLLTWLILVGGQNPQIWWFAAALIFSLAGDVFLLFSNRYFLPGLFSFAIAHLTYALGLNPTFPPINIASLTLLLLISFSITQLYRFFFARPEIQDKVNLRKPILVYLIALGLLVFSALVTMVRPEKEWQIYPALLASTGALLFFSSDILSAWNRYIHPTRANRILITIMYHIAQFTLIFAAVLNYS